MAYGESLPANLPTKHEEEEIEERDDWQPRSLRMTSPAGDLAHEISRVIYDIREMDSDELVDNWDSLSQFIADVASRIPGITERRSAEFLRDFEDLSDMAFSVGMENVAKTKVLKHLYSLRMAVATSEVPLMGLSGVSSLLTTKNESKQQATITDNRQPKPSSIFDGLSSILGKKPDTQQNRGEI